MPELNDLVRQGASVARVAEYLDGLTHEERLRALSITTRAVQRTLYNAASASPPLTLDFFVPGGTPPRVAVHHKGRNSLPLPPPLRVFEKRFAAPEDGSARLFGYNEGLTRAWIGPGYFVAVPTAGNAAWQERGAIVIDYFQVPDGPVPDGWPNVVPNSQGLQSVVYAGTRDFMRRVSKDVSIGAAFKGEKALDHYFTLCREPRGG
ncbi:hypothetical protein SOCEGT47_054960 [Sorangium cellulosum]|uniref:Uncharacterized protein n=1 Tax=Sorangium cellulosum TaxID=56 RepID=A0A4P2Q6A5_SORCE|nr:hypothetical protein [Sorangium cellulosum]AUX24955.1 hypothetical protein SOCEGT47_054960 [Sorangium cellulosum]